VTAADQRADRISARVTGIGVGLITLMVIWLISARIMERIFTTPTGAYAAMALAVTAGVAVSVVMARRFVQQVRPTPSPS